MHKNIIAVICREYRQGREFYIPAGNYARQLLGRAEYQDNSEVVERAFAVADRLVTQVFDDSDVTRRQTDCLYMGEKMLVVAYRVESEDWEYFTYKSGVWLPVHRIPDLLKHVHRVLERASSRRIHSRERRD